MTKPKRSVAEFQTLIQNLPELLHILMCGTCYINQIDGYNALIETAIVLMLSAFTKSLCIRSEERTASHTRIYISVLVFLHLLGRNIVRNHTLGCTFCSKLCQIPVLAVFCNIIFIQCINNLRECRCDPDSLFVLYALHTLFQNLFNDQCKIRSGLSVRYLIQIHEHGYKRCLSVTGHQGNELILNCLHTTGDFFTQTALNGSLDLFFLQRISVFLPLCYNLLTNLLTGYVNKRSQMRQCKRLSAVLVGSNLCNDLCCNVAGGIEAVRLLNLGTGNDRTVLQHILQIDQITVVLLLCIVVGIMEMNNTFFMRLYNILRKKQTLCKVAGNLAGHIITLCRVDYRILVGIFLLKLLVCLIDQRQDVFIGCIGFTCDFSLIAVTYIFLSDLVATHFHDACLYHVLDIFYINSMRRSRNALCHGIGNTHDLIFIHLVDRLYLFVCLPNRIRNLRNIKFHFLTVTLDYLGFYGNFLIIQFHTYHPFLFP